MKLKRFEFMPILGWSASRYDIFSGCKGEYFYEYYGKYDPVHSRQKIDRLKYLTSVPLETGNIVHDVIKAVLQRLRRSEADLDAERFRQFVKSMTEEQCRTKTFLEVHYKEVERIGSEDILPKIERCVGSFLSSPRYDWIRKAAIPTRDQWIIEPPGYGEARIDGLKVYCKIDFLFPAENRIVIVDWKTGKEDEDKHTKQLTGYTAWAAYHLDRCAADVTPVVAYLQPEYREVGIPPTDADLFAFRERIERETKEMYAFCRDIEENLPLDKSSFPATMNLGICRFCNFQELCER
jgi:CRISPR/Cas system-associated exonuclease Cas4 (RecB family)